MAKNNTWKTLAIIFIILFVLETAFIIWMISIGLKEINIESECIVNICGSDEYDAYYYDTYEEICYCYKDHEVTHQEFMG